MRYRITHLLILTAVVLIGLVAVDRYTNRTVLVEFRTSEISPYLIELSGESGYALDFTIQYKQYPIDGLVGDYFGFNQLLGLNVDSTNVTRLDGRKIHFTYRKHPFLWLPATRVEDQIESHFKVLLVFANAEEWHAESKQR